VAKLKLRGWYIYNSKTSHFLEFKREDVEAKAADFYEEKQDALRRRIRRTREGDCSRSYDTI